MHKSLGMRLGIYQGYSVHNLTPRPFHVQEEEVTLGMRLASKSHSNVLKHNVTLISVCAVTHAIPTCSTTSKIFLGI